MAKETIPTKMTGHRPNLPTMRDPDFLELVWENNQILIRSLSCKITNTKSTDHFPCSGYFSQSSNNAIIQPEPERETSTANRSNDGVADSTLGDPLSISGLTVTGLPKLDHNNNHHKNNKINSYLRNTSLDQACYNLELLSQLYEDDSRIVPVNNSKIFEQSRKLVEEIPNHTAVNSDGEVPVPVPDQSSSKQCEAPVPCMSMRSKEQNTVTDDDERRGRVNFSFFLRSPALLKSTHPSSGATRPTNGSPALTVTDEDILQGNVRSASRSSSDPFEILMPLEQTTISKNINLLATNMKPAVVPDSEPQKEILPDEQSEAVGYKDTRPYSRLSSTLSDKVRGPILNLEPNNASIKVNENPCNGKSAEQMVAASSVCSHGASNNPIYTLKRRYEDSTDLSEHGNTSYTMEEAEGEDTRKAAPARGSKGAKRKRKAEVHNLSERRRRDKINKKMRALQELIPNCNKVDKASMLDEAIEYLKTLQLQVQMMSMGNGVYMPPNPMMLPTMMQHMNMNMNAQLQQLIGRTYSPMAIHGCWDGNENGNANANGYGYGVQTPSTIPNSAWAAPSPTPRLNNMNMMNMMGFPGQVLLMSMSPSPFSSLGASRFCPQSQSVQPPPPPPAVQMQVELPGAAAANSLSTSKDSNATSH